MRLPCPCSRQLIRLQVVRDVYAPIVEQVKVRASDQKLLLPAVVLMRSRPQLRLPCQSRAPSILIPGSGEKCFCYAAVS